MIVLLHQPNFHELLEANVSELATSEESTQPVEKEEISKSEAQPEPKSPTKGHKISNMKVKNKTPWKASLLSYLCLGVRTGDDQDQEQPRKADRRSDEVTHRVNKGPYSRPLN